MRYVTALFAALLSFVVVTFAFVGTAAAADLPPDSSWIDLAKPVVDAAVHGSPALACALALVLAVALARRYAPPSWKLDGDIGGTALTFLGSLGAACAAALTAGSLPSWALLGTALSIAAGASGGYTAIKRLAVPALRWLEGKLPAWAKPFLAPLFNIALWAFESKTKGAADVAKAEKAGADAVQAKPSQGADGVVSKGKSFP